MNITRRQVVTAGLLAGTGLAGIIAKHFIGNTYDKERDAIILEQARENPKKRQRYLNDLFQEIPNTENVLKFGEDKIQYFHTAEELSDFLDQNCDPFYRFMFDSLNLKDGAVFTIPTIQTSNGIGKVDITEVIPGTQSVIIATPGIFRNLYETREDIVSALHHELVHVNQYFNLDLEFAKAFNYARKDIVNMDISFLAQDPSLRRPGKNKEHTALYVKAIILKRLHEYEAVKSSLLKPMSTGLRVTQTQILSQHQSTLEYWHNRISDYENCPQSTKVLMQKIYRSIQ